MRRGRLAWIFALVLALELALLCCACAHMCSHVCPCDAPCAICLWVRTALRPFALPAAAALTLAGLALPQRPILAPSVPAVLPLVDRKVRMND